MRYLSSVFQMEKGQSMLSANTQTTFPQTTYWDEVINYTNEEGQALEVALEKLRHHESKSLDLEFIHIGKSNYHLLSFRMNHSDRGLGTIINYKKKNYFILLQVVYNHDYHKTILTQKGGLNAFMRDHEQDINRLIDPQEPQIESPISSDDSTIPLMPHKKKPSPFIIFSEEQQQLLMAQQNSGKVLLVTGGPGSGKTIVALGLLKNELAIDHGTEQTTMVYLAQSPKLVEVMRSMWQEQINEITSCKKVLFLTYEEFIHNEVKTTDKQLMGETHFRSWIQLYLKKGAHKKNEMLRNMVLPFGANPEGMLYKEFRIRSGYTTDEYLDKSTKSLFSVPEQREWINQAFNDYQLALEQQKLFNPVLQVIAIPISYDYILVDEAQDLSGAQLKSIHAKRLCFFYDPNQTLDDCLSKTTFLINLHDPRNIGGCSQFMLNGSYRFPETLMRVANKVLELKLLLVGGVMDKENQRQIQQTKEQELFHKKSPHSLQWISKINDIRTNPELLEKIAHSTRVAIITSDNYVDEAKKLFNTASVFTPESIKGLEFYLIIIYRPLDHPQAELANKKLANKNWGNIPQNLPKKGQEHDPRDILFINQLYTAITRSESELLFVQEEHHKINHLVTFLKQVFDPKETIKTDYLEQSSSEDWLKLAEDALHQGNSEYAREIFARTINHAEHAFITWEQQILSKKTPLLQVNKIEKSPDLFSLPQAIIAPKRNTFFPSPESTQPRKKDKRPSITENIIQKSEHKQQVNLKQTSTNANQVALFSTQYNNKSLKEISDTIIEILCSQNEKKTSNLIEILCDKKGQHVFFKLCQEIPKISMHKKEATTSHLASAAFRALFNKEQNTDILSILFEDQHFVNALKIDPNFIPFLLVQDNQYKSYSNLYYLLQSPNGQKFFCQLCKDKLFLNKLFSNEKFIPTVLTRITKEDSVALENTSILLQLCSSQTGIDCLNYLYIHQKEKNISGEYLFAHSEFIPTLLAKTSDQNAISKGVSCLFLMISSTKNKLSLILKDIAAQLCNHKDFFDTLLTIVSGVPNADNLSAFLLLLSQDTPIHVDFLNAIYKQKIFFSTLFSNPKFINTLVTPACSLIMQIKNISCLHLFFLRPSSPLLYKITEANVWKEIFAHEQFIPSLLCSDVKLNVNIAIKDQRLVTSNCLPLLFYFLNTRQFKIFAQHCLEPSFFINFYAHKGLIPCLLMRGENGESALHALLRTVLGRELFNKLCAEKTFIQTLLTAPGFLETLDHELDINNRFNIISVNIDEAEESIEQGCIYIRNKGAAQIEFKALNENNIALGFIFREPMLTIAKGPTLITHLAKSLSQNSAYKSVRSLLEKYIDQELSDKLLRTEHLEELKITFK